MARDRQRAKQRRAKQRQPGQGGAARTARDRERDLRAGRGAGLDPDRDAPLADDRLPEAAPRADDQPPDAPPRAGDELSDAALEREPEPLAGDDARDPERDAPIPGDEVAGSPLGAGTAAPDPLDHASAEVDIARLSEAGAPPAREEEEDEGEWDEDEDDLERAPDEAEGDVPIRRSAAAAEARERSRGRVITFLGHCVDELRRVQWPDRRHVGQATAVVLGFVVLAGGYLGLLDALWRPLVEAIL